MVMGQVNRVGNVDEESSSDRSESTRSNTGSQSARSEVSLAGGDPSDAMVSAGLQIQVLCTSLINALCI